MRKTFIFLFLILLNLHAQWENLGPAGGGIWKITKNDNSEDYYAMTTGSPMSHVNYKDGNITSIKRIPHDYQTNSLATDLNDELILVSDIQSIVISTNFGSTWDTLNFGADGHSIPCGLFLDPIDNNSVHVLQAEFKDNGEQSINLFSSKDKGDNWSRNTIISSSIPVLMTLTGCMTDSGDMIFSLYDNRDNLSDLYIKKHSETEFKDLSDSLPDGDLGWLRISKIFTLYNPSLKIFLSRGDSIFVSDDKGNSWESIYFNFEISSIAKSFVNHDLLAICGKDGLLVSRDGGEIWDKISTPSNLAFNDVTFKQNGNDILLATPEGFYTYEFSNNKLTANDKLELKVFADFAVSKEDGKTVFALDKITGTAFRSDNYGEGIDSIGATGMLEGSEVVSMGVIDSLEFYFSTAPC